MSFNSKKCKDISAEAQRVLREHFGDDFRVTSKNGTFEGNCFSFKIEFLEKQTDGTVVEKIAQDFKEYARVYGLQPDDLGKTFVFRGKTFKIIGLNIRSRKRPIVVENSITKKQFIFEAPIVAKQNRQ